MYTCHRSDTSVRKGAGCSRHALLFLGYSIPDLPSQVKLCYSCLHGNNYIQKNGLAADSAVAILNNDLPVYFLRPATMHTLLQNLSVASQSMALKHRTKHGHLNNLTLQSLQRCQDQHLHVPPADESRRCNAKERAGIVTHTYRSEITDDACCLKRIWHMCLHPGHSIPATYLLAAERCHSAGVLPAACGRRDLARIANGVTACSKYALTRSAPRVPEDGTCAREIALRSLQSMGRNMLYCFWSCR